MFASARRTAPGLDERCCSDTSKYIISVLFAKMPTDVCGTPGDRHEGEAFPSFYPLFLSRFFVLGTDLQRLLIAWEEV